MSRIIGLKELEAAIQRNPSRVKSLSARFIDKGLRLWRGTINTSPWRIGGKGGGAPVRTGDLLGSHRIEKSTFRGSIGPDRGGKRIDYANYVHGGTRKMQARPWLDYAVKRNRAKMQLLERDLLKDIVADLAR